MVRRLTLMLTVLFGAATVELVTAERAAADHGEEVGISDEFAEALDGLRNLEPSIGRVESANGYGTGWVAGDGMVVTNLHVTRFTAWEVRVRFPGFLTYCYVAAGSEDYDLAVLRCDTRDLRAIPINLATGTPDTPIAVIGYPRGEGPVLTSGVMTGERLAVGRVPTVGFDAEIHPGSSGSPVLDANGNVRAVATFGGGYGVPARELMPLLETARGAPSSRQVAEWRVRLIRSLVAVGLTSLLATWRARRAGKHRPTRFVIGWTLLVLTAVLLVTQLQFAVFGPVRLI